jgi:hypothetical protein
MKGDNDPTFVISFRSQKEFALALGWKSSAMIWGGAAITLLGIYMLLAQTGVALGFLVALEVTSNASS